MHSYFRIQVKPDIEQSQPHHSYRGGKTGKRGLELQKSTHTKHMLSFLECYNTQTSIKSLNNLFCPTFNFQGKKVFLSRTDSLQAEPIQPPTRKLREKETFSISLILLLSDPLFQPRDMGTVHSQEQVR